MLKLLVVALALHVARGLKTAQYTVGAGVSLEIGTRDFAGTVRHDRPGDATGTHVWPAAAPLLAHITDQVPRIRGALACGATAITREIDIAAARGRSCGLCCGLIGERNVLCVSQAQQIRTIVRIAAE